MSLARTAELVHTLADVPHPGRRYRWISPDRAVVLVEVKRLGWHRGRRVAHALCHYRGQSWNQHFDVPLRPSLTPHHWTDQDLETR